jgi:hypothetical protein
MQEAGIDSGMTRTTSNAFGYGGQWSETSTISIISPAGQLAFVLDLIVHYILFICVVMEHCQ